MRKLFRKLKPLSRGSRSGAVSRVKVPSYKWFYHEGTDLLFFYERGAFYSHARIPTLDGDNAPFSRHRTRRPLPSTGVRVATVDVQEDLIQLRGVQSITTFWEEVTDSDDLEALLLERNAEHLRQCTVDGTPFAISPLDNLFGRYGINANADAILKGTLDVDTLPLSREGRAWLRELRSEEGSSELIDVGFTPAQFRTLTRKCNTRTSASPSGFGYVVEPTAGAKWVVGCSVQ